MKRAKLIAARDDQGLSQEEVAEHIGVNRVTVSQWERGRTNPYPFHVHRLCKLFGKSAEELGIGAIEEKQDIKAYQDANKVFIFNRRNALVAMPGALLMPGEEFSMDLLERFARALKKPSMINDTTLNHIDIRVASYWRDHYAATFAASDLISDVVNLFQKVIILLENSLLPTTRSRLCITASRIAQLAGSLYSDAGYFAYSREYKQAAIFAARQANDAELEAVSIGRLAKAYQDMRQWQNAKDTIQEARRLAKKSTDYSVHGWFAAVEAEIQALLGNRTSSLEALSDAECIDKQPAGQDDHWLHFDHPSLVGYQGACYRRLYD